MLKKNQKYLGILLCLIILIFFIFNIILHYINLNINQIPNSLVIYDINGVEIGEIVVADKYRHRDKTFQDHPDFLKKAVITLEDKSYYTNNGISWRSVGRAMIHDIQHGSIVEGASTISAQLIRNNYGLNEPRSWNRKFSEFFLALALNTQYSKEEILTRYLNTLYFGYLNYGFESAAHYYFSKNLNNLTKAEIIALITIYKNSNKYNPLINFAGFQDRYKILIDYFYQNKLYNAQEYLQIKNEKLLFTVPPGDKLPYIIDYVKKHYLDRENSHKIGHMPLENIQLSNAKGYVYTTVDYYLTENIQKLANATINSLARKGVSDYSIIIINRDTNALVVMIGGIDFKGKNGQVNSVLALRQLGSTIKPFTYLLAFQNLGLKPENTILDLPVEYKTSQGYSYTPKNFTLKYKGEVTIAHALAESLNVPAVRLTNLVGTDILLNFLRKLGISSLQQNAQFYGLALTLGVGEISLYELTRAYGIFAHEGKLCDIKTLTTENTNCTQLVDKEYINSINLILSNRYFKINGFPINSNLDFSDKFVFVKSGTSREFKDNCVIGYTNKYLIGIWVGNKDGENMRMVSGVAGAGEIFRKIVYYLEPDNNENLPVALQSIQTEYVEIISPTNGAVYKKENLSNINQKIKLDFKTNIQYTNFDWILDNKPINDKFIDIINTGSHILQLQLYHTNQKVASSQSNFDIY